MPEKIVREYVVARSTYTSFTLLMKWTLPYLYRESEHYQSTDIREISSTPQKITIQITDYWRTKEDYAMFRRCNPKRLKVLESKLETLIQKEDQ